MNRNIAFSCAWLCFMFGWASSIFGKDDHFALMFLLIGMALLTCGMLMKE